MEAPDVKLVLLAMTTEQGKSFLAACGATPEQIATVEIVTTYPRAVEVAKIPEVDMKAVVDDNANPLLDEPLLAACDLWIFHHPRGPFWHDEHGTPVLYSDSPA